MLKCSVCNLNVRNSFFLLDNKMFYAFLVLLSFCSEAFSDDKTCEDMVTSEMKMKLVRDSLNQVKVFFPECRDPDDKDKCSKKSTALAHMNLAIDTLERLKLIGTGDKICPKCPDPIVVDSSGPVDCQEIFNAGYQKSGIYTIYPKHRWTGSKGLKVYCDMDTEGGGWTVIQRRGNYSTQTNFHETWDNYKKGFGSLEKDFWLGNEHIFALTNQAVYTLRIDMKKDNGEYRYSQHAVFFLNDEESNYTMYIQDFSGDAGNSLASGHNIKFSTKDRQNDGRPANSQCALLFHGAWWYTTPDCGYANLNAMYNPGLGNWHSNFWYHWTGHVGLFFSEMKIRPRNYESKKKEEKF